MTTVTIGNRTGTTFTGTEDAVLVSGSATTNFSAEADSGQLPFIIRFSGLSNIAGPVTVSSATITLNAVSGGSSSAVAIQRILRGWVETEATWNSFSSGNAWGTAGALNTSTDIVAASSATLDYTGGFATGDFVSINNTTLIADVEAMINGTLTNNGWRVDGANPAFGLPGHATASGIRPVLTVVYALAVTTVQTHHRWRNDDGSETTATWAAAEDAALTAASLANKRLRVLVDTTGDLPSTQFQLEYKLSSDSAYFKLESAGGGSLAYGTIGSNTTTGTTAPTVAYPASIAAGDILCLAIANRPNASTPSTPSGWTPSTNYTATGGAGSEAAGTGTVRITFFWKVADGTESGSLTLGITSGASCGAVMWRCTRTTGKDWSVALANGSDNSAGTSVSVTFGSDPGVAAGDLVFVAYANSEDTATFASEDLAQTGMTYGTMNERADFAISTGNDLRLVVTQHDVTSGTSSAAAVWTATASSTNAANSAGPAVMIRLRQVDAAFQLSGSANITASGENTTAQLTPPGGKSTSDFVAGRAQDDENPADAVDVTVDDYTELEWCIQATANAASAAYDFRVTLAGTALSTYSVSPSWTVSAASSVDPGVIYGSATVFGLPGLVLN